MDLEALKEAYQKVLGSMTAPVAWMMEGLMKKGMQPDVIIEAIQETAWAPRPSPAYLRTILQRYMSRGILTMQAVLLDRQEWDAAQREPEWWT